MNNNRLAVHETMELSEILTFKNVCLTKNTVSQALVQDETLRQFIRQDIETTQKQIRELQGLLSPGVV